MDKLLGVYAGGGTLVSFSARAGVPCELLLTQVPSPGHTRAHVQSIYAVTPNIPTATQPSADRTISDNHRQLLIEPHPSDVSRHALLARSNISRHSISTQIFTNKMSSHQVQSYTGKKAG